MAKKKGAKSTKDVDSASQKSDSASDESTAKTELRIYQEKHGDVPFLEFLAQRKDIEKADIRAALEELQEKGHLLRPPHNEHLGDQLYYLRVNSLDGTYRIFYWPYGRKIVILGHGFSKKTNQCPSEEIKKAKRQRDQYAADSEKHTYRGENHGQQ